MTTNLLIKISCSSSCDFECQLYIWVLSQEESVVQHQIIDEGLGRHVTLGCFHCFSCVMWRPPHQDGTCSRFRALPVFRRQL